MLGYKVNRERASDRASDSCTMSSSANLNCPTIVVNKEVGIGVFHDEVGV